MAEMTPDFIRCQSHSWAVALTR